MLEIDGSMGEGGGQVLRSSLSLAALTGQAVVIDRIRAGRAKPGLMRQHLTAVRAAAEVCDGEVEGATLRSRRVVFRPGKPRAGRYQFVIGTAGSTTLVCQTVLPILLAAEGESEVHFEGGTHNPMAPPYDFLERVFAPVVRALGAELELAIGRPGFYPAGGGRFSLHLSPPKEPKRVTLSEPLTLPKIDPFVISARLPQHVAEREAAVVAEAFSLDPRDVEIRKVKAAGPGNVVGIAVHDRERVVELSSAIGEKGRPAETVARNAVADTRAFLTRGLSVGEHLADQLLLPMSFGGGAFVTGPLSLHASTNVEVLRLFLGSDAASVGGEGEVVTVAVKAQHHRH
ncbi:MAG: RNA 3'-terminal phosphate cyclase [Polyangiaceae bacterium]